MASRRKRATVAAAGAKKLMLNEIQEEEHLPSSDICTYWPANPAFDPQSVLFRRLLFINGDRTK